MPDLPHIGAGYAHYPKQAVPREAVDGAAGTFKLYHLEKPREPISAAIAEAARGLLAGPASGTGLAGDHGFVILHRCGADFHFLLLTAWRGSNEAWEAVWYRDGAMDDFAPFAPAYPDEAGVARPTFCVWELAIVAHEARAWSRFLASPRGAAELAQWRDDMFAGAV